MEISTATAIAIYFIIWWVVLFAVLPWGIRSQEESGEVAPGTDPGAPAAHVIWRKLLWTTITAAVVFGVLALIYKENLIPIEFLKHIANPPHS
jgi:predicted secreted protein